MVVTPARTVARPVAGSPGFAALLTALLPGLGQVYQDRVVRGLLMFLLPPLTLFLVGAFVFIAEPLARAVIFRASLVAILLVGLA